MFEDRILTVSDVNRYIKNKFDSDFLLNTCVVKGEVSNCKYHTSGHIYFTLKDNSSQISCVMFAGQRAGISFSLKDGQAINVYGRISVYEPQGKYQIYADRITLDGVGRLYEEYERLKSKLSAEGLFDLQYKKPIPKYVRRVGIVTARTGAAIQDICQISRRRNPYVSLILYPAQVQGVGASDTVVRGIKALDGKVDVIIVGRGGGSIEDLWAFNEENTARAIFNCKTPIISAVGHETDTTIADYVSDLRAPTPSAAAELAVYDIKLLEQQFANYHGRILEAMLSTIDGVKDTLERTELRLKNQSPESRLEVKKQKLEHFKVAIVNVMQGRVNVARNICDQYSYKLPVCMNKVIEEKKFEMKSLATKLEAASPIKKLSTGFSYVENEEGKTVTSVSHIKKDQNITMFVTDGKISAKVTSVQEIDYGNKENTGRE